MPLTIHTTYPQIIKNATFKLFLLIYILMNTANNYTTIHLQLNWTNVLEVITLLIDLSSRVS